MELDEYLTTGHLFDCSGRITHTFLLQVDGTVRVEFAGGRTITVDPRTRSALTPGATLPDQLWPEIFALTAS